VGIRRTTRLLLRTYWVDGLRHKYHFIHIPKNGGESVRYALELDRDISLSRPFHYRYVDIVDRVGADLRYFCVVRNPWSRTASRYMFGKQNAGKWPIDDPRRQYMSEASFESYVKEKKVLPIPRHPGQPWMGPLSSWFNQLEWIRDKNGSVACDCLRLEHIEKDIGAYLRKRIRMPHQNVTKYRYDYRLMYTPELVDIVAETFRDDIEHFGFSFEGAATRNIATLE
jgi:hypothetical protein